MLERAHGLEADAELSGVKVGAVRNATEHALDVLQRALSLDPNEPLPMSERHIKYLETQAARAESLAALLSALPACTRPPTAVELARWLDTALSRLLILFGSKARFRAYLGISWMEDLLRLLPHKASGRPEAVRHLLWKLVHHRLGVMPDILADGSSAAAFAGPGNTHFEGVGLTAVSVALCLTGLDKDGFPTFVTHHGREILVTTSIVNAGEGVGASWLYELARRGERGLSLPLAGHKLQDEHGGAGTINVMLVANEAAKALRELRALGPTASAERRAELTKAARAVPPGCIMYVPLPAAAARRR